MADTLSRSLSSRKTILRRLSVASLQQRLFDKISAQPHNITRSTKIANKFQEQKDPKSNYIREELRRGKTVMPMVPILLKQRLEQMPKKQPFANEQIKRQYSRSSFSNTHSSTLVTKFRGKADLYREFNQKEKALRKLKIQTEVALSLLKQRICMLAQDLSSRQQEKIMILQQNQEIQAVINQQSQEGCVQLRQLIEEYQNCRRRKGQSIRNQQNLNQKLQGLLKKKELGENQWHQIDKTLKVLKRLIPNSQQSLTLIRLRQSIQEDNIKYSNEIKVIHTEKKNQANLKFQLEKEFKKIQNQLEYLKMKCNLAPVDIPAFLQRNKDLLGLKHRLESNNARLKMLSSDQVASQILTIKKKIMDDSISLEKLNGDLKKYQILKKNLEPQFDDIAKYIVQDDKATEQLLTERFEPMVQSISMGLSSNSDSKKMCLASTLGKQNKSRNSHKKIKSQRKYLMKK